MWMVVGSTEISSLEDARFWGSFSKHFATKSKSSGDHFDGSLSVGEGKAGLVVYSQSNPYMQKWGSQNKVDCVIAKKLRMEFFESC
jgi:hypothetical protein